MTSEPAALAWDRQVGEPESAYSYFMMYRDIGLTRTVVKVADRVNKSRDYIHKMASQWRWVARVRAFDAGAGPAVWRGVDGAAAGDGRPARADRVGACRAS